MKKPLEFEYEADDNTADIIDQIQDLAAQLGWSIALPEDDEEGLLDHIIIGTEASLVEIDRTFEVYTILTPPDEEDEILH